MRILIEISQREKLLDFVGFSVYTRFLAHNKSCRNVWSAIVDVTKDEHAYILANLKKFNRYKEVSPDLWADNFGGHILM